VAADSVADSLEKRFMYLTEKIMPQFSRDSMDHTLIFIPSYFDFVRVRNWFKASDLDLAEVSEYSKDKRVAKARDEFYHNEKHFLLYTERAHFFRRFRIKGIRHLVFFQPPTYPGAMTDLCNLQQAAFQNPRGGSETNMSCTVLYTRCRTLSTGHRTRRRYDALRVAQCVGSEPAATMLGAESPVHRFQPS
jgi:U3 small nucleolar RNA-associated protein 25